MRYTENRKQKTENYRKFSGLLACIVLLTFLVPTFTGCGAATSVKNWVTGNPTSEEDEETVPAEAQQETVMIDGKPYVRSKNPYWLTYPEQPEYIYVEKGREFKGMQQRLVEAVSKAMGKEKDKGSQDSAAR